MLLTTSFACHIPGHSQNLEQLLSSTSGRTPEEQAIRAEYERLLHEKQAMSEEERESDSIISDKVTLEQLLKAYMDIIAVGGKRGLAPLILTQRFAQVNKKIMAQSELFFILRQTMDKDLERCMEYVKRSTATEEDISRFQQGEGVYIGLGGEQFVTHFFKRHSDGSRSHTPTAEAAHRYAQMPLSRP